MGHVVDRELAAGPELSARTSAASKLMKTDD
jgi:hypothetical protein